ncbi:methyltransferase [Nesterenkonia sp. E16_7]|uniref:DUF7059 domain-containing protein n=1 Tax=unclassified Nesterenkonia TaxID=2629769 RepID=UPI001A91A3C0|nr:MULTISPECIES: methyltransferase [unclassified Nesterenkonia]MBO0595255.1 methyltransferase [Nesterenkonia sp. E16_10]MBO0598866.1 methyltransferase [Nesterenkonia sp. E16_7]
MSPAQHQPAILPAPESDPKLLAALRADLLAARFTNERIAQLLGEDALAALQRDQPVPAQLRVHQLLGAEPTPDPCAVLTGLWLLGLEISAALLQQALPQVGVAGLCRLNLVHPAAPGSPETSAPAAAHDGERYRPSVDLRPYQAEQAHGLCDLWVASDLPAAQVSGPLPPEHVLGIGGASLTLAASIHRAPVRSALEIGAGCGIQLLHLLDHAEHVVATDLSRRALDFTRFNLVLNAATLRLDPSDLGARVELVQGSLLEPVAGRRFDLIISNPPFVITPRPKHEQIDARYTYRDGGRAGDLLMAELIAALPEHLAEAGTAQLLGNWEIQDHAAWDARPQLWCEAFPASVDAWFIQRDRQDSAEYAETWLRDASTQREPESYRRRYREYLDDFASRGVLEVGFGMIFLRRRAAASGPEAPWRRFEELTGAVEQPLGPVIGATATRAEAVARDPQAVLEAVLTVAPDVTEERHQRFGAHHPEVILARQGSGLRRSRAVSSAAAGFLGAADGEFQASALTAAVAALLAEETTEQADLQQALRSEILELYLEGYLAES